MRNATRLIGLVRDSVVHVERTPDGNIKIVGRGLGVLVVVGVFGLLW